MYRFIRWKQSCKNKSIDSFSNTSIYSFVINFEWFFNVILKDLVKKMLCTYSSFVFTSLDPDPLPDPHPDPDPYGHFWVPNPDPHENLCGSETLTDFPSSHLYGPLDPDIDISFFLRVFISISYRHPKS